MSTSDADLIFSGPRALATMVRSRELSARELTEASLRQIEKLSPPLNAFRTVLGEQALAAADELDQRAAHDFSVLDRPLAGVPLAVKDDTELAGQSATYGSRSPEPVASADAEFVSKLRAAGANPVGVTNVPELMLFPWTATTANGVTRNPWDRDRTPGGSSGGSASAVASGMVPIATASDGGGSIRIPAACCGLVGMKSTRGRVSSMPLDPGDHYGSGWLGLATYGALARTVADSAMLLDVIHGSIDGNVQAPTGPRGTFLQAALTEPVRPLRVAISRKLPAGSFARLAPDQRRAWDQTARLLSELGHQVEERDPDYGLVGPEFIQTYLRAAHEAFGELADPSVAEKSTRQLAALGGRVISERRRDKVLATRAKSTARIGRLWDSVDVLLTPGLASTAIKAEGGYGKGAALALDKASRFMPWFPTWNLTGQPAISLPAGFGTDGLPLSIQLVGRHGAEEMLYSLAGQIEAARPWAGERPPIS